MCPTRYKCLEEEIAGKTKKMKKVFAMLTTAKTEISDLQKERKEQNESMIEHTKEISKERKLAMKVIGNLDMLVVFGISCAFLMLYTTSV